MFFEKRFFLLIFSGALAIALPACSGSVNSSTGSGGSGGSGGSSGGSGGSGGTMSSGGSGGMATGTGGSGGMTTGTGGGMSLSNAGTVQDDCAPNDGPAIRAIIGGTSTCNAGPNAAAQVDMLAYPGSVAMFAPGTKWDQGNGLDVQFLPMGQNGGSQTVTGGHLDVVTVSGGMVELHYSFEVGGTKYDGNVTVTACPSMGMCG